MRFLSMLPIGFVLMAGCATTWRMTGGEGVPAADGVVTSKASGDNGNTRLDLKVRHLALPDRVTPGASTYVVWAKAEGGPPTNIGALRVDKNLEGELSTLTPLRQFLLTVTAEPASTSSAPSGPVVLSARITAK